MDVDDPTECVDKTMDEILITEKRYQYFRQQPWTHVTHNHIKLITTTRGGIILNRIKSH